MNARRSFLARLGAAAAALGLSSAKTLAEQPLSDSVGDAQDAPVRPDAAAARWQPARHSTDDWLDQLPGKHRLFFDTISPQGVRQVQGYVRNYFEGHKSGYGLESTDLAVVICLRHRATQFAFTDAIWGKYGAALGESEEFTDPKTGRAPAVNVYKAELETQVKRGVHFAVCNMSTHRLARFIAKKVDGSEDGIYKELIANAITNAHFVPAGIIAVNHAQERGYSIAYTG
jgi:intracellular sulfur oxidation DsrE/DsrF family protein